MFRLKGTIASSSSLLLASHIPRSAWDPAHYHENWTDSYGTAIAARRQPSSKRWSVGLTPSTPRDWLQYSSRNLAYAYNGALRACGTDFQKMVALYKEMKERGVKVDVDTLHILLTRGARYEKMRPDDLFLLVEELVQLGARPDMAAIETLHTVWDHSAGMPVEWREVRQKQLVQYYNYLAEETVDRLSHSSSPQHHLSPHLDALMAQEMARLRGNVQQLHARLSARVYRKYFHAIQSSSLLLRELHQFVWEFVPPDHPAIFIPGLNLRFPFIASVMRRPPLPQRTVPEGSDEASSSHAGTTRHPLHSRAAQAILQAVSSTTAPTTTTTSRPTAALSPSVPFLPSHFEDVAVNDVFLAAVERLVEADFTMDHLHSSSLSVRRLLHRRVFLSLLSILESTGVLFTPDLMAQLMDVVKYSEEDGTRDADARRVLRYALRGSCASRQEDYRAAWLSLQSVADGRVVGRYIASRHPWTMTRIVCDAQYSFKGTYPLARSPSHANPHLSPASPLTTDTMEEEKTEEESEKKSMSAPSPSPSPAGGSAASALVEHHYTVEGFERRWRDVKALIQQTRVLDCPIPSYILSSPSSHASPTTDRSGGTGKRGDATDVVRAGGFPKDAPHAQVSQVEAYLEAAMEVFTGQVVFLRTLVTGRRYDTLEEAFHVQARGADWKDVAQGEAPSQPHPTDREGGGRREVGGDAGYPSTSSSVGASPSSRMANSEHFAPLPFAVWQRVYDAVEETYREMEQFIAQYSHCPLPSSHMPHEPLRLPGGGGAPSTGGGLSTAIPPSSTATSIYSPPEPEFECWEGMLIVLHSILDFCTAARQQATGMLLPLPDAGVGESAARRSQDHLLDEEKTYSPEVIEALFKKAATLRTRLIEESRSRFGGRFRILWLHEV